MYSDSQLQAIQKLKQQLEGELFTDKASLVLYATDASAYRELPIAIVRPKNIQDIKVLIAFAQEYKVPLIPRAAGTSLAGQVVGTGIVVDISRYMTNILEINKEERWVRVQPGVILDELNKILEPMGLFFGPETSTSNRCMIGGMVGNNSCGSHSLVYGSTRDHVLAVQAILSDGSEVEFSALSKDQYIDKCKKEDLEGKIYQQIDNILKDSEIQKEIREQFPDPDLRRRNTGYAIDYLLETNIFTETESPFNFCNLITGSEGTLCFMTEIKLNLVPLPPKENMLVAIHHKTLKEAFKANLVALKYHPVAVELMDHIIIEQTLNNITQRKNRFFIEGSPEALLLVEFASESRQALDDTAELLEAEMRTEGYGYHFPRIYGKDISKVWALRKAGLGVLSNIPGDAKPVAVIEDTAVSSKYLPDYIDDFMMMLEKYHLNCVYYGHSATGELHLRPVLNLKAPADLKLFRSVAFETAKLVKKHKGSLSGEHGDGRLRGEFIPLMLGDKIYQLFREIKQNWDPSGIFNPGKITDTPPMDSSLRYEPGRKEPVIDTIFDFSSTQGILKAAEQCNGSGDCRRTSFIGGLMCPSYQASMEESTTTRARANILREFLTHSTKKNPFDHKEIYDSMDLCLSCKGCKSECPSNVDITKYKAEFMQHWYDEHGVPMRSLLIAHISKINWLGSLVPAIFNFTITNSFTSNLLKKILGFAPQRSIPKLYRMTLKRWIRKEERKTTNGAINKGTVYLFVDEFTNYNDTEIGIRAYQLLTKLGYNVLVTDHGESGRTYLSKGLIRNAKKIAIQNVMKLKDIITPESPFIGIEPSGILCFRDEYIELVGADLKADAVKLSKSCYLFDEFIVKEIEKGNINQEQFTDKKQHIRLHGHCHQKALATTASTARMLTLPQNYTVDELKTGCCGMAGAFGYEKEHYSLSMKVGGLKLFPEVKNTPDDVLISAPGTSCRHQIKDGTGKRAYHPIEILYDALKTK
ncbi:MAG: FAD-binding protein [Bacteroidetes bacterium]|nr:FAD-binding protein [Bacteroidota bacterium]